MRAGIQKYLAVLLLSNFFVPQFAEGKKKVPKRPREHFLLVLFPELKPPDPKKTPPEETFLALQNKLADERGLPRIEDTNEYAAFRESGYLAKTATRYGCFVVNQKLARKEFRVPAPGSRKKQKIVEDLRYAHPDSIAYFGHLAEEYCGLDIARRSNPFVISSLIRTGQYQKYGMSHIPNARQAIGDVPGTRSLHWTGHAFDISVRGHNKEELIALAKILIEDKKKRLLAGVIFEPRGNDFHVMVMPSEQDRVNRRPN